MKYKLQIVEGDLREVPTEDGIQYFPDLEILATSEDGTTLVSPISFPASRTAYREATEYIQTAKVDATWSDIKTFAQSRESYSNGDFEPFDEEELYYMQAI